MRYLLIVLAFVSGMLCTERAVASEAEDFYEYASYFHGTWISEQEGSESIVVCEAKATYNLCSFNGGMAHEIWGYDPVKRFGRVTVEVAIRVGSCSWLDQ